MKDQNLLKNLTLIVCSYQRHDYLKNLIKYWWDTEVSVIILDNSKNELDLSFCKNKKIKIDYMNCYNVNGFERLKIANKRIKTKFVLLHHDDDVFLKSTLIKCIKFLIDKKEYVAIRGLEYDFWFKNKKIVGDLKRQISKNESLLDKNFINRKKKLMENFNSILIFSLIRVEAWKSSINFLKRNKLDYYHVWEIFFSFSILYFGKVKVIKYPFILRNKINLPIRYNEKVDTPENNLFSFFRNTNEKQRNRIYKNFWLQKKKNSNKEIVINSLREDLLFFIQKDYKNYKQKKNIIFMKNVYNKIRFAISHYYKNYKSNVNSNLNFLLKKSGIDKNEILIIDAHIKNNLYIFGNYLGKL